MAIKKYVIEWNWFEVHVVIDDSIMTEEKLHEINNFWCDSAIRLDENGSNVALTVTKMLAETCFKTQISTGFNTYGVMKEFDQNYMEGWPKMDGSEGILITRVDAVEFDYNDMANEVSVLEEMPAPPKRS